MSLQSRAFILCSRLDSPTCRVRLKVRLVNLRTSDDVRHFPKIVRLGRWEAIEMQ